MGYVKSSAKFFMLRKAACTHRVVSCSKSDPRADYYAQNIRHEDVVFFRSGQFKAALAKTVDHLFGTSFQNEQQFNEGRVVTQGGFRFRLRQDDIAEVISYSGSGKELDIPETVQGHVVTGAAPFCILQTAADHGGQHSEYRGQHRTGGFLHLSEPAAAKAACKAEDHREKYV